MTVEESTFAFFGASLRRRQGEREKERRGRRVHLSLIFRFQIESSGERERVESGKKQRSELDKRRDMDWGRASLFRLDPFFGEASMVDDAS
jgi:hypothetical protein